MAVLIDTISSPVPHGSSVSTLTDTTLTIGTGANRALLVSFSANSNDVSPTVTWGAQTLTQLAISVNGFDAVTYFYGLLNPTSGTQTLTISWAGGVSAAVCGIAFIGVEQSSLANAFTNVQQTQAASGTLT